MSEKFTAALVQMTSGQEVAANVETICERAREAKGLGADFVLYPEVATLVETGAKNIAPKVTSQDRDPGLVRFRETAKDLGLWMLIGSMVVKHETEERRFANRSVLINAAGDIAATYDKIHMFDVDLDGGESYRESKSYVPGEKAVLAETPWGVLGMSVCYDLRFPYLYRHYAHNGAKMLAIPAAFTRPTGRAHWHSLQRARAIENACFVLAPAQCGEHEDGRKTYGHSLIVDPWGEVLADGGEEPGIVTARIDLDLVDKVRAKVPSLKHDRPFT